MDDVKSMIDHENTTMRGGTYDDNTASKLFNSYFNSRGENAFKDDDMPHHKDDVDAEYNMELKELDNEFAAVQRNYAWTQEVGAHYDVDESDGDGEPYAFCNGGAIFDFSDSEIVEEDSEFEIHGSYNINRAISKRDKLGTLLKLIVDLEDFNDLYISDVTWDEYTLSIFFDPEENGNILYASNDYRDFCNELRILQNSHKLVTVELENILIECGYIVSKANTHYEIGQRMVLDRDVPPQKVYTIMGKVGNKYGLGTEENRYQWIWKNGTEMRPVEDQNQLKFDDLLKYT
jgi:hypothetical protein